MIIVANNDLDVRESNVVKLDISAEGKAMYVSRDTYDQAVILRDIYKGDSGVTDLLTKIDSNDSCKEYIDSIYHFNETMPEPINILAPFLSMVSAGVILEEDDEVLLSIIDSASRMVDFVRSTRVDKSLIKNIKVPLSVLTSYKRFVEDFTEKYSRGEKVEETIEVETASTPLEEMARTARNAGLHLVLSSYPIGAGGYGQTEPLAIPGTVAGNIEIPEEFKDDIDEEDLDAIFQAAFANMDSEYEDEEVEDAPVFEQEEIEEAGEVEEVEEEVEESELTPEEKKALEIAKMIKTMG